MYVIYRKFGKTVEITEFERKPDKVRVHHSRKRSDAYPLRRPDNIRRTKTICMRRVSSALEELGSPLLVTLTFRGDASDASYANDSLRYFQVRLRTQFPEAQSIFVPELSPRGRIHFHGLLFYVPLSLGDTRIGRKRLQDGDERKTRMLAGLWREGFVDALKTDGSPKLASYISKYITKGAGQIIFNAMRLLRISHGFPKEIVVRDELVAGRLRDQYASRKPDKEWEGGKEFTVFLGKVTKKTYYL